LLFHGTLFPSIQLTFFALQLLANRISDIGRVSLLSQCRILASAELSGCIWQHQWQPMPRSRCQNSAAVSGEAAVC